MADQYAITEQALLADIAARRVYDDTQGTTWLRLGGDEDPADVSLLTWRLERTGLAEQQDGSLVWRLTDAGRVRLREVADA